MIPKSGYRFSEKIMLKQGVERDRREVIALRYLPVTPASSWAFSTCGRGIEMTL